VLLRSSLANAPALLEQAAQMRAAAGEARQAHAYPNPSLGAEIENLGAARAVDGSNQRQSTFTITQPFEIGGKRSARIAAGESMLAAARARGRQAEVEYAAQLAVAYATAEAAEVRLRLADDDVARAREDLKAAGALVKAGKEADLRLAQAQAGTAAALAARETASADMTEAYEELSTLAGSAKPYAGVAASLLDSGGMRAVTGPTTEETPAVSAAIAEREALAAQVRLERARTTPDIGLSGGLRRFGGSNGTAAVVGLSAAIPLFDRNGGNIAAAKAREDAAEARLANVRLQTAAHARSAMARASAAEGRLAAAAEGERAASEAYRLGRIGYDAGKISLVELLFSRRALSDAKRLTIDARLARVEALAALARAQGRLAFGE
jgi:cobalt-zinc-cadmium efflux system outer membrane protein